MRVLLTSVGSAGDIHPFIAIGLALVSRGHAVALAANPYFEGAIAGAGLHFLPMGEFLSPQDVARQYPQAFRRFSGARVLFRDVFGPLMTRTITDFRAIARDARPDAIVGHQISFGLPWIAEELGVPWAATVLAPCTMLSNHDPSVYPIGIDVRRAPMWVRRLQHRAARTAVNTMLDPLVREARTEMGIARRGDTLFGEMLEARVLGMFSPAFRGPAADDPPGLAICGFPWFDRSGAPSAMPPNLEAFLDAGSPPVVIAMGSVLSQTEAPTLRRVVRAARSTGHRVVLVGRDGHSDAGSDPAIIRVDYAPFSQLFPRAGVIVHHGGIGTTAQGLRSGVPSLVLAFAHDQFDNAARVARLGVGARGTRATSERAIAAQIDRLTGDAGIRAKARELGETIAREDGALTAATVIEGMI